MIYLDYAATTPLPEAVADTMYDVLRHQFGNPSAQYPLGREAKELVEEARRTIAGALGCQPSALYFTSCGTETRQLGHPGRRMAGPPHGAAHHHHRRGAQRRAGALQASWNRRGMRSPTSSPTAPGISPPEQVADALREDTVLVSVMLVNNETGCRLPRGGDRRGC